MAADSHWVLAAQLAQAMGPRGAPATARRASGAGAASALAPESPAWRRTGSKWLGKQVRRQKGDSAASEAVASAGACARRGTGDAVQRGHRGAHAQSRRVYAPPSTRAGDPGLAVGWWQVRRSILDKRGDEVGYGKGKIVGWLSAAESDFVNERTKRAAALWHVVFDEVCEKHLRYSPTSMGEEDLEEHEVREAVESFLSENDPPAW